MARAATAPYRYRLPPARQPRLARWWLCTLALLLLAAQQWGQVHALGHVLGKAQGQTTAIAGSAAADQPDAHGSASHDEAAPHQGAGLCELCLVLAAFSAAVLPGLLRWRSARLGQAGPRGPPPVAARPSRCWVYQARGPPFALR